MIRFVLVTLREYVIRLTEKKAKDDCKKGQKSVKRTEYEDRKEIEVVYAQVQLHMYILCCRYMYTVPYMYSI